MSRTTIELDCLIFGAGAAGLFTLDRLRAEGYTALAVESTALGAGQTRCAQGIIHGGTKYALGGLLGADSRAIAEMPERWLGMVAGRGAPALSAAALRSRHCWLWRSDTLSSRLGMLGARLALRVRPEEVAPADRPEALHGAHGAVLRLAEPIFDPVAVLESVAEAHRGFVAQYASDSLEVRTQSGPLELGLEFARSTGGTESCIVRARSVILAAGAGNEALRERFGCEAGRTQRRPLHQVLVRSMSLPWLDGHCVDGDATRVTVTSARDSAGRIVWHLGGRLAEEGVALDRTTLLRRAADEVRAVLPDLLLANAEWATYRVDRAEPSERGRRPDDARIIVEGSIISLWPTKLALAPRAAELAATALRAVAPSRGTLGQSIEFDVVHPAAAPPPWHDALEWTPTP